MMTLDSQIRDHYGLPQDPALAAAAKDSGKEKATAKEKTPETEDKAKK